MADYISALTGPQMDAALYDMATHTSEAYAIGERNGVPVDNSDVTYHNNSKYFAQRASTYATTANAAANRAEAAIPAESATGAVFFDRVQNLTDAQKKQVQKNIGASGSNPNLLDNWWWGISGLINQRGVTTATITSTTYMIDRWFVYGSGSYTVQSGGIEFSNPSGPNACLMCQKFPGTGFFDGKVMTASILMGNGTTIYSGTITRADSTLQHFYQDDSVYISMTADNWFRIQTRIGTTHTIRAVKLELGYASTLAYDSYPNKAEELNKCLYYFERVKAPSYNNSLAMGFSNGTSVYAPMMIHPKRITPTLSYNGTVNIGKNSGSTAATAVALYSCSPDTGHISLRVDATSTSGDPYRVILNSGGYVDFSADL